MNWNLSPSELFTKGPIVPVIVIKQLEHAIPIAKALMDGGIYVMEITLRTDCALAAIKKIADELPEVLVGAGTIINKSDLKAVIEADAKFAISPGLTADLLEAGKEASIPLIPGVSSASELMTGLEFGYDHFKFFPAEASGGIGAIKSIGGPFPTVTFCPTGGINPDNYTSYLSLSNVACCGGSWLVPDDAVDNGDWGKIAEITRQAVNGA